MKTKLAVLLIALTTIVHADDQALDYKRFEKWLAKVEAAAPSYGLKIEKPMPEGDREFFYLYCWQSDDHSVVGAIATAKKVWSRTR